MHTVIYMYIASYVSILLIFIGTTGLSRPLSVKSLGRSSLSKASGAKSVSKMSGEEESLEKCAQSILENSVSAIGCLYIVVQFTAIIEIRCIIYIHY